MTISAQATSASLRSSVLRLISLMSQDSGNIAATVISPSVETARNLTRLPETMFETNDAIFVTAETDQAQQLIETQQAWRWELLIPGLKRSLVTTHGFARLICLTMG